MEIGCYPGKFLAVFGEKGYELNGVDSFHGTDSLSGWFKSRGYRYNHFYEADIFDFKSQIKYDLVCSFGFIEHFNDLEEVLDKHLELLKPGGKIIIDVPNLNSPIYYFLYKLFEPDVLKNHVLSSMNLKAITSVMIAKGCRIDYSGYVGRFYFRFVTKQGVTRRCISKVINLFSLLLSLLPDSLYKRYIGVIATKVS
ncbi:MAG: class I SAM-dependent methyltransferase [Minisyncoccia bacterium]|jgi:SAM-dependent methyltransferase